MKNQALFSSKGKSKKLKCRLLQFLFGALRVTNNNKIIEKAWLCDQSQNQIDRLHPFGCH